MTRKDLIQKLLALGDDDTEVSITDGYEGRIYEGNFYVCSATTDDGVPVIDIGIGGLTVIPH